MFRRNAVVCTCGVKFLKAEEMRCESAKYGHEFFFCNPRRLYSPMRMDFQAPRYLIQMRKYT